MTLISRSLYLSLLIILIMMIPSSAFYYLYNFCSNTSKFESNSIYQTHLNTVFHSLSSNGAISTGFFATSSGNATTEAVYGLFMCRGDQDTNMCHDCVATATTELPQKYCVNSKEAIIWYEECMVRYSNESIVGKMDQSQSYVSWYTDNITGDLTQFTNVLGKITNTVSYEAANGGSLKKYATAVKRLNSLETMYALGQCTPDLSVDDCNQCLSIAIKQLPICLGAVASLPSCNIEYETYPFFNGATNLSLPPALPPQTNLTGILPVISTPTGHQKRKVPSKIIIAIVLPVAAISLMLGVHFIRRNAKKSDVDAISTGDDDFTTIESLQYDFGTLQSATNNFSDENKLGEGGFGRVYKGTLPNGQDIAVKRLSKWSGQGIQEFKNEVLLIAKLQHRNLVRILGFCFNRVEKLLVYEYVPNKSLNCFLFDPKKQVQLDWEMRYKIIKGIARGMLYLHQDSQFKIVHRDLKASNILLDKDMNPKIADFGMARIFAVEESESSTRRVVGTYGYIAPEYAIHGKFSIKSDVYSFGVVALEIISGKRNNTVYQLSNDEDLLSFAWMKWRDDNPLEFMDPIIRDSCSYDEVMRCMQLGLLCVHESVEKRPTMATVNLALESYLVTLPVPERPTFFGKSRAYLNISLETVSDQLQKDVSITELDPR